jgi:hypothetical protein
MNLADLLKKNFVLVPVVASVLVGTFTGVRYIVNLTDTINSNQQEIINLQRDLTAAQEKNYRSKHKTNFCRIYVADGRKFI